MPTRSAAPAELMAGARKALVWAWGDDGVPAGELTCRAPVRVLRREWRASMGPSPRPEWWSVLVVREVWSSEAGKWREAWGSCLSVEQELSFPVAQEVSSPQASVAEASALMRPVVRRCESRRRRRSRCSRRLASSLDRGSIPAVSTPWVPSGLVRVMRPRRPLRSYDPPTLSNDRRRDPPESSTPTSWPVFRCLATKIGQWPIFLDWGERRGWPGVGLRRVERPRLNLNLSPLDSCA